MKKIYTLISALAITFSASAQSQIDLPITWDDPTNFDYTTIPFGGNFSALATDPSNASNDVLEIIKPLGAETWAGVTLSTTSGLASLIPFEPGSTVIKVKVYSPDAGIVVRLKAEVAGTPTESVETDQTTTVSNDWEVLSFDFSNEATGTAAINYSYNYNMLSIFFNFGVTGNTAGAKTYYCDSVFFDAEVIVTPNVTFRVDMNQYSGTFTTPEVNGTFNGWCGNCNAMSDVDADGIWEITLPISDDSIEFKYAFDNWTGQETLTPGSTCTKTTSGFTNRFMHITGDTVLPAVCWESCVECSVPVDTTMVTFRVDMNDYTGTFTTPEVNGTFNGWCGNCNAMSDDDADGIWEITLPLTQDSIEYKFAYDNWTGQEALTAGSFCTKTTAEFTNRFLALTADTVLPAVCWNSCEECEGLGIANASNQTLNIYPNPSTTDLRIESNMALGTVSMFDINGRMVYSALAGSELTATIDVTSLESGVYTLQILTDGAVQTKKVIVSK